MENIVLLILDNLAKIGIGALLFSIIYLSNMGLGAWKSITLDEKTFDKNLIKKSLIQGGILILSVTGLSIGITTLPEYANYIGYTIPSEYTEFISNTVIGFTFAAGSCIYAVDGGKKVTQLILKKG